MRATQIAAARRRLPMVEVDARRRSSGANGASRCSTSSRAERQLFVYFHMWHDGKPAEDQCEGCTFFNGHVRELSYLHSRDVTYAMFCQGPFEESNRYREFMGWDDAVVLGRRLARRAVRRAMDSACYVCYLRDGDRVFETYWSSGRGTEAMATSYGLLDMTVYGRQETWEDSPDGWPQAFATTPASSSASTGRPTAAVVPPRGGPLRRPQRITGHRPV